MSDSMEKIDWEKLAGEMAGKVRPETRSKYFPKNPLRRWIINGFLESVAGALAGLDWKNMLDIGCGEGFVDYFLGRRFPGRGITGLEPDPEALEVARSINPGFEYMSADGRSLPFPDDSFDLVICCEVLEHLTDFRRIIEEAGRVSRGACLFSVPGFPWYQGTNFLIGKNWPTLGEHPDHVVRFTRERLKSELESALGPARVMLSYPWLIGVCGG